MAIEIPEPLFTWVHLSDIHIGHGDAAHGLDQQLVLEALRADIRKISLGGAVPRPDALLVTGDLAFSGNVRTSTEYDEVCTWLLAVADSINVAQERIFVVPGNHDVQLDVAKTDNNVARLLETLRSGREKLDGAHSNASDRALLQRRMQNYLTFAQKFAPANTSPPSNDAALFWVHQLPLSQGLTIRFVGFNTALLCEGGDADRAKLQLGNTQIAHAFMPTPDALNEVVIVLSHHPFDWLRDEREASEWTRKYAHIHLCGHIHEAQSEHLRSGGGQDFVRIVAGAAHNEPVPAGTVAQHGYNFGTLWACDDGQLVLRVWPRIWSQTNRDFRVDVDNVPPSGNSLFVDHELRFKFSDRTLPFRDIAPKGVPPTQYKYDVFISYSHTDQDWVRSELLPRLEEAGLKVIIDYRDFEVGAPSLVNMERAADDSRHTLVVLTPAWIKSEWTEFESLLAGTADPAGRRRKIIPLLLKACELPSRIAMLTYADFTKPAEREMQMARLLKSLSTYIPVPEPKPSKPGITPDVILVLTMSDLKDLAELLSRGGRANQTTRKALCIEIGIDSDTLDFLDLSAPRDFALQLVHRLHQTDNVAALRTLCDAIAPGLSGQFAVKLATIRTKLQ